MDKIISISLWIFNGKTLTPKHSKDHNICQVHHAVCVCTVSAEIPRM